MPRSSTTILGLDDEKGQQELRPRGPSAMLSLSPYLKVPLRSLNRIIRPHIYLSVNILNPPAFTTKWYKVGQPCYEDKMQELNSDIPVRAWIRCKQFGLHIWSIQTTRIGVFGGR